MNILGCNRCGLCRTRKQVVPGKGTGKSGVMLIGEAPGKVENEQGLPFVGRAGKLLDKYVPSFWDKDPNDLYTTNVVKCWPPTPELTGNRRPTDKEIVACSPWLDLEIKTIKPYLIITLGEPALIRITGEGGIGMKQGCACWSNKYNCLVFVLYHPAYILRNTRDEEELTRGFRILGTMMRKPWGEVEEWIKSLKLVAKP